MNSLKISDCLQKAKETRLISMFNTIAVSAAAENNLSTIGFVFALHCSTITDEN